jgi:hypothetical protein
MKTVLAFVALVSVLAFAAFMSPNRTQGNWKGCPNVTYYRPTCPVSPVGPGRQSFGPQTIIAVMKISNQLPIETTHRWTSRATESPDRSYCVEMVQ